MRCQERIEHICNRHACCEIGPATRQSVGGARIAAIRQHGGPRKTGRHLAAHTASALPGGRSVHRSPHHSASGRHRAFRIAVGHHAFSALYRRESHHSHDTHRAHNAPACSWRPGIQEAALRPFSPFRPMAMLIIGRDVLDCGEIDSRKSAPASAMAQISSKRQPARKSACTHASSSINEHVAAARAISAATRLCV